MDFDERFIGWFLKIRKWVFLFNGRFDLECS